MKHDSDNKNALHSMKKKRKKLEYRQQ